MVDVSGTRSGRACDQSGQARGGGANEAAVHSARFECPPTTHRARMEAATVEMCKVAALERWEAETD